MKAPSTHPPISPKVKGLYIGVQAVLALYAQWVWSQKDKMVTGVTDE
jgi:hypothetical protein